MNTKILLAIAGAAALSACTSSRNPDASSEEWEFPLVELERSKPRPRAGRPATPAAVSPNGFRVPDVTQKLPDLRNRPDPSGGTGGPSSVTPPTPPPTVTPSPELAPTPGPEAIPAPEPTPDPPSE